MAEEYSIPTHRTCTKCGQDKELELFGNATRGRYGKKSVCKTCERAYMVANKDRINALSLAKYHKSQVDKKAKKAAERAALIALPTKRCALCEAVRPKSEFRGKKHSADGLHCYCKACCNKLNRDRRAIDPERDAEYSRRWAAKNPEKRREIMRRHVSKPSTRFHAAVSSRIYDILKGRNDRRTTEEIIGYSFKVLRAHVERQFIDGMTWSNYGQWHLDHIVPLSAFMVTGFDDPTIKAAWALSNLRPLWATENLKKNAKRIYLL